MYKTIWITLLMIFLFSFNVLAMDDALFKKLDRDGDGRITREEFVQCDLVRATLPDGRQVVQERSLCVQNGKTTLTVDEKSLLFKQLDTARQGSITYKEFKYGSRDGFVPFRF
jgi:Ca2+-binding EF-hand superfamily protein